MDNNIKQIYQTELKRGTLILLVLSQLNEKEYGYSLLQKLVDKHVEIEAGTLYPLMRRLENQDLLTSEWVTTTSRPRKYYVLSEFGRELYEYLKKEFYKMTKEVKTLVGGNFDE